MKQKHPSPDPSTISAIQEKIKELGDLLCVCAGCKAVRAGSGEWRKIERFLQDYLEVKISHGLCPSCAAEANQEIESLSR